VKDAAIVGLVLLTLGACDDSARIQKLEGRVAVDEVRVAKLEARNAGQSAALKPPPDYDCKFSDGSYWWDSQHVKLPAGWSPDHRPFPDCR
jgi:hypothetical protein